MIIGGVDIEEALTISEAEITGTATGSPEARALRLAHAAKAMALRLVGLATVEIMKEKLAAGDTESLGDELALLRLTTEKMGVRHTSEDLDEVETATVLQAARASRLSAWEDGARMWSACRTLAAMVQSNADGRWLWFAWSPGAAGVVVGEGRAATKEEAMRRADAVLESNMTAQVTQ